jgi:hypothetical protein
MYIKCECGADCKYNAYATKKQPCWGTVVAIETSQLHYCEGHAPLHFGGEYLPEPKDGVTNGLVLAEILEKAKRIE